MIREDPVAAQAQAVAARRRHLLKKNAMYHEIERLKKEAAAKRERTLTRSFVNRRRQEMRRASARRYKQGPGGPSPRRATLEEATPPAAAAAPPGRPAPLRLSKPATPRIAASPRLRQHSQRSPRETVAALSPGGKNPMSPRVGGQTVMPEFGALRLDLLENRAADEELFHQLATSSEQKAEMLQQMTRGGGAGPRTETASGKHAELVVEMRQKASVRRPPSAGQRRLLPGRLP